MKQEELKEGSIYYEKKGQREIEFGFIGCNGNVVCYNPGDRGGGMQSAFIVDPKDLSMTSRKICPTCNQEVLN